MSDWVAPRLPNVARSCPPPNGLVLLQDRRWSAGTGERPGWRQAPGPLAGMARDRRPLAALATPWRPIAADRPSAKSCGSNLVGASTQWRPIAASEQAPARQALARRLPGDVTTHAGATPSTVARAWRLLGDTASSAAPGGSSSGADTCGRRPSVDTWGAGRRRRVDSWSARRRSQDVGDRQAAPRTGGQRCAVARAADRGTVARR